MPYIYIYVYIFAKLISSKSVHVMKRFEKHTRIISFQLLGLRKRLKFRNILYMVNVLEFRTPFFLFSNKMWAIKTGIHKMLVRIANREDPSEAV